jgi:hypothetical protein
MTHQLLLSLTSWSEEFVCDAKLLGRPKLGARLALFAAERVQGYSSCMPGLFMQALEASFYHRIQGCYVLVQVVTTLDSLSMPSTKGTDGLEL